MLFLAVFCGFLAEYQLEHKIEKDRVREYMKSLFSDLSADTTFLNEELVFCRQTVQIQEAFEKNLYSDYAFDSTLVLYRQYGDYLRLLTPQLSDQTITQLRNAGNLRLIKNKKITDKLSEYWNGINVIKKIAERVEQRYDLSAEMAAKIFNRKYLQIRQDLDTISLRLSNRTTIVLEGAKLMTKDKNQLIAYANIVNRIKTSIGGAYTRNLRIQHKLADELMELIKEEYSIK